MKENIIPFPAASFPSAGPHRLGWEENAMTIKHTHPEHKDAEEREEKLQDIQRSCAAVLAAMRANAQQKQSA